MDSLRNSVVDIFISSKDIDPGTVWFSEISGQLSNAELGIVCLTEENKNKPWILFEAGALTKGLSQNKVCTFLVDLVPTDLENPLAQFNHTLPSKQGLHNLISTINKHVAGTTLKMEILDRTFNTFWPGFEFDLKEILNDTISEQKHYKRDDRDILLELLSSVRELTKSTQLAAISSTNKITPPIRDLIDRNQELSARLEYLERKRMHGIDELSTMKSIIDQKQQQPKDDVANNSFDELVMNFKQKAMEMKMLETEIALTMQRLSDLW